MKHKSQQSSLIDSYNLDSPFATEFRRLLHNIKTASKTGEVKTVLVTSAVVGEGKSTVTSFLAITAARKQMRTLVIDCDLRRPSLHRLLDLPLERGVAEALAEGIAIRHTIKKTTLDKLDIITAGRITSSPAELFEARTIGEYLSELKFYYDLILVDCAPILPVSDPMMLAQEVDGVLIVIKAGDTQRELVGRATEIIQTGSSRILGVVMNNLKKALPYYYQSSHYSYPHDTPSPSTGTRIPDAAGEAEDARSGTSTNSIADNKRVSG